MNFEGNQIGIVVAMKEEAMPIIKRFGMDSTEDDNVYIGKTLSGDPIILMISGIGKVNAQNTVWALATLGCEKIVSFGTSGFCGDKVTQYIYYPNLFFDGDFDFSMFGNPSKDPCNVNVKYVLSNSLPENPCELYSYSTFIQDKRVEGHIVDMETYAEVAACNTIGLPFISIRVVSDTCDKDEFEDSVEAGESSSAINYHVDEIADAINNFDATYAKVYKTVSVEEE